MSLITPDKIRSFQRKLYGKAKAEPAYRFYRLYDKIYRADILEHAYALARHNDGAPGVDGVTFEMIEAAGLEGWLAALRETLASQTYRPMPVRRVTLPKPGGGERPLGIPTLRDRVVQTAAKLVLEPIFEADLEDNAYGYRPKRSALNAVTATHRLSHPPGLCGCRRCRSVQILRHHPASRAHAKRGSSNLRPSRAAADQAVAACSGRGA